VPAPTLAALVYSGRLPRARKGRGGAERDIAGAGALVADFLLLDCSAIREGSSHCMRKFFFSLRHGGVGALSLHFLRLVQTYACSATCVVSETVAVTASAVFSLLSDQPLQQFALRCHAHLSAVCILCAQRLVAVD